MSVGFIMYEIVDKDSLKYQGINTDNLSCQHCNSLDIHLKIKILTPVSHLPILRRKLDIHLNIKVLTPTSDSYISFHELDIHLNIKVLTP